jgi:hypothetical protein
MGTEQTITSPTYQGTRKIYMYRDEEGTPTGSCVVGMVSVEEALRVEAALDGKWVE